MKPCAERKPPYFPAMAPRRRKKAVLSLVALGAVSGQTEEEDRYAV
jgi:hypothetical protein